MGSIPVSGHANHSLVDSIGECDETEWNVTWSVSVVINPLLMKAPVRI